MKLGTGVLTSGVVTLAALAAACSSSVGSATEDSVGEASSACSIVDVLEGAEHFSKPLSGTNGRSCATCHVETEHFSLSPQHVAALYAKNPHDPLFNPIDADDPTAAVPTYDHLKAGLVRVTLKLADNLDVIDANGNVITNADRTIWVWRGVPSIENVGYTAPYQYDGRAATLEVQALGALQSHSQISHQPSSQVLNQLAGFEKTVFSSLAAAEVAEAMAEGWPAAPVDLHFPPGSDEAKGQVLFQSVCAKCHGSPTTNVITDKAVNDSFFPVLHADGTIDYNGFTPAGGAVPTTFRHDLAFPQHMGLYGVAAVTMLQQIGALPNPSGLSLPQYRIRFYTDATRKQKRMDMPPPPPAIGPALVPEPFSVDPGRAIITGDPYDWEGFDVPQLRGIAKTAPYFHDASAPDLHAVLDEYSRFFLPADPAMHLPAVYPPEGPGMLPEALTPAQKAQLFAFLQKL